MWAMVFFSVADTLSSLTTNLTEDDGAAAVDRRVDRTF
jgi:hypothetical protein